MSTVETQIRPLQENDKHFIFSTWLKSCRYSLTSKRVPNDHYFAYQQVLIRNLWNRPRVKTLVLSLIEDPGFIVGYICFERTPVFDVPKNIVHFAYVRGTFQNEGFLKTLLDHAGIDLNEEVIFTHYTLESSFLKEKRAVDKSEPKLTAEVLKSKFPKLVYNPYLSFF